MVNLDWCKTQGRGIKLIKPNDNLADEYLSNAAETLVVLREIGDKSNMWLATTKYYFEYFCAYSILMKIGIKCEIHDCTIKICGILKKEGIISDNFLVTLKKDKELRIENQYYLKNKKVDIDYDELSSFYLQSKNALEKLTMDKIKKIRDIL